MNPKEYTVEDEYKKNKDLKKEDVKIVQEWMNKQAHLPKINDLQVILFLHSCYYKIEAAKTCIENFYTVRAHWPELSQNRNILSNELQQMLHQLLVTVLPQRTKHNHIVMYTRLMNTNPDVFNHINQIRVVDMIYTMWFKALGTTEGQVMLMDMHGAQVGHLLKMNLAAMKKQMYYVQEALPIRLKAIHIINVSPITDKFLSIAKPFMAKEMVELMHLHTKLDTVYDHIPKKALPKEFGGEAGTFEELHEKQIKMMEDNVEFFLAQEKEIADESKRQGKPKNLDNIFGIEGTFKKLDID